MAQSRPRSSDRTGALLTVIFSALSACIGLTFLAWVSAGAGPTDHGKATPVRWMELPGELDVDSWPQRESLKYRIKWNGLTCASLNVSLERSGEFIVMEYAGATHPLIDRVWTFQMNGKSWFNTSRARPARSVLHTREGKRRKSVSVLYRHSARRAVITTAEDDTAGAEVEELNYVHGLDLPALFVFLRDVESLREGVGAIELLQNDTFYAVRARLTGNETVNVPAGRFRCSRFSVDVGPVRQRADERDGKSSARTQETQLWISETDRLPVKITTAAPVGTITAELQRRTVEPSRQ